MTLDKHRIDGLPKILDRTMLATRFEQMLIDAGYTKIGSAPAKGNRSKAWWTHSTYQQVEVIYSGDSQTVVTAHHTV